MNFEGFQKQNSQHKSITLESQIYKFLKAQQYGLLDRYLGNIDFTNKIVDLKFVLYDKKYKDILSLCKNRKYLNLMNLILKAKDQIGEQYNDMLSTVTQQYHSKKQKFYQYSKILIKKYNIDIICNKQRKKDTFATLCKMKKFKTIKLVLQYSNKDIYQIYEQNYDSLMVACKYDCNYAVKNFLKQKKNYRIKNCKQSTCFQIACQNNSLKSIKIMLYQFCKHKNLNQIMKEDQDFYQDIYYGFLHCCENLNMKILQIFLKFKLPLKYVDKYGFGILHKVATIQQGDQILKAFIDKGLKIDLYCSSQMSPFMIACKSLNFDVAYYMYKNCQKINLNEQTSEGDNLFILVCRQYIVGDFSQDQLQFIFWLYCIGVDIMHKNKSGYCGFQYLSEYTIKVIEHYIIINNLNMPRPDKYLCLYTNQLLCQYIQLLFIKTLDF